MIYKDRRGKKIINGTKVRCVNDVEHGKVYDVKKIKNEYYLQSEDEFAPFPASMFNEENGCLVDFELLTKTEELTKSEFIKKMNKLRKLQQTQDSLQKELYDQESNAFGEEALNYPSNAECADNIDDAITCFIQYGEYSPEEIWEDIME